MLRLTEYTFKLNNRYKAQVKTGQQVVTKGNTFLNIVFLEGCFLLRKVTFSTVDKINAENKDETDVNELHRVMQVYCELAIFKLARSKFILLLLRIGLLEGKVVRISCSAAKTDVCD